LIEQFEEVGDHEASEGEEKAIGFPHPKDWTIQELCRYEESATFNCEFTRPLVLSDLLIAFPTQPLNHVEVQPLLIGFS
jgi:hypothetical protein